MPARKKGVAGESCCSCGLRLHPCGCACGYRVRHEGGGEGAATVLDIQRGYLPDARQKGRVFQPSQMERLQKHFFFFLN